MRTGHSMRVGVARWLPGVIVAGACLQGAATAPGQDSPIVRVEEEWELVVLDPDGGTTAPQITLMISPTGDESEHYATFEINHKSAPSFAPGGLHLHLWNGAQRVETKSTDRNDVLSTNNEKITWKVALEVKDGQLTVEVANGASTTFGGFGGGMRIVTDTTLTNLNGYSAANTLASSGIGFASNRVQSLRLTRVRRIAADGEQYVNYAEQSLFEHD